MPPSRNYIENAAHKFAEFSDVCSNYVSEFKEPIRDFHNPILRYEQYISAHQNCQNSERIEKSQKLHDWIESHKNFLDRYQDLVTKIPKRVFHHDTKFNNLLFQSDSTKVLCPVDLDTVMPGYIFSDFGDMVWSWIFGLDHNNLYPPFFDRANYQALVD